MENKATFKARLVSHLAPSDVLRVMSAYYMAKYGHRAQLRQEKNINGEPLRYFEHVRRVALNVMDVAQCWDPDLICAALLHDAIEDTEDLDAAMIEQLFGKIVARHVVLLSKVPKEGYVERLKYSSYGTVLVKACDRLDNLRSLPQTPIEFQIKQIKETREIYWSIFVKHLGLQNPVVIEIEKILD